MGFRWCTGLEFDNATSIRRGVQQVDGTAPAKCWHFERHFAIQTRREGVTRRRRTAPSGGRERARERCDVRAVGPSSAMRVSKQGYGASGPAIVPAPADWRRMQPVRIAPVPREPPSVRRDPAALQLLADRSSRYTRCVRRCRAASAEFRAQCVPRSRADVVEADTRAHPRQLDSARSEAPIASDRPLSG